MGKNKGKQFNNEKRVMLSRMVAKGNKAKEIGDALGMDPTSVFPRIEKEPHHRRCSHLSPSP